MTASTPRRSWSRCQRSSASPTREAASCASTSSQLPGNWMTPNFTASADGRLREDVPVGAGQSGCRAPHAGAANSTAIGKTVGGDPAPEWPAIHGCGSRGIDHLVLEQRVAVRPALVGETRDRVHPLVVVVAVLVQRG